MTITARVIADSSQYHTWEGVPCINYNRLTTFVLRYPRFIHAEFMTHRVFSRNASSSRAIPIQKMMQAVIDDPAMPVWWGKNQAGMQAREELDTNAREQAKRDWLRARDTAVEYVERLSAMHLHKQIANRILEPWAHIEVVVTGTDWANFYALRDHPDAQPEMQELAKQMLIAHKASTAKVLRPGQWHVPYVTEDDYTEVFNSVDTDDKFFFPKVSSARCARVSYLKHDGAKASFDEEFGLYDKLMAGHPKHASPTEHQARVPISWDERDNPKFRSNLRGWTQFRKLIAGENVTEYKSFYQ